MTDAELIERHGGPTKLAKKMNLSGRNVVQRIQNWKYRGIPAKVKLEYASLFLGADFQNLTELGLIVASNNQHHDKVG